MATMGDRIKELRVRSGLSLEKFGKQFDVSREMVGQWERNESAPKHARQKQICDKYDVSLDWLSGAELSPVDFHNHAHNTRKVAGPTKFPLTSDNGGQRTDDLYEPLEPVYLIGDVQAGAWRESNKLPREQWRRMDLPADPNYPGVPRYALRNVGESMNNECEHGGTWVFVQLIDLAGIGAQPGDYVIVERRRTDGLREATCKRLEIRGGKAWLCPDSRDKTFEPFPIDGDGEIEEIRVVGIVTDVINKPGRKR